MTTIHLKNLLDDRKCYETIRQLRWPDGLKCPACNASEVKKRGFHSRQAYRQRYVCLACHQQFDDLTETIFEGHHQPLRTWILCLYLMGLNLSNEQIAQELDLSCGDVQAMTSQLRAGIVSKKSPSCWAEKLKPMKFISRQAIKDIQKSSPAKNAKVDGEN